MEQGRSSRALESARRRLEKLQSIVPAPNFGPGLNISVYTTEINDLGDLVADYNTMKANLKALALKLRDKEKSVLDLRERILTAIAFLYGKNSAEYVAAGGIRKSERKRPRSNGTSSAQMEN